MLGRINRLITTREWRARDSHATSRDISENNVAVTTESVSITSTISETMNMDDPTGPAGVPRDFDETVEQLRERLAAMKRLVGDDLEKQRAQRHQQQQQQRQNSNGDSIIDGKFLSVVFAVVLLLIVCVSSYAFLNLYYAILKKFPAREHSEL